MMCKVRVAFIMSISVALAVASNQALGQSGSVRAGIAAPIHSNVHPNVHPSVNRAVHHRIVRNRRDFFPNTGAFFWGPSNAVPNVELAQPVGPISGDFNYTYKYDVPWDWAHRYPPSFFASPPELPAPPAIFHPGCAAQAVTVPGTDGKDQTINMVRC
jgi:hypothetical protein